MRLEQSLCIVAITILAIPAAQAACLPIFLLVPYKDGDVITESSVMLTYDDIHYVCDDMYYGDHLSCTLPGYEYATGNHTFTFYFIDTPSLLREDQWDEPEREDRRESHQNYLEDQLAHQTYAKTVFIPDQTVHGCISKIGIDLDTGKIRVLDEEVVLVKRNPLSIIVGALLAVIMLMIVIFVFKKPAQKK